MKFTLVIPCFNEAHGLAKLLSRCRALLDTAHDFDVILVDNGSNDDTPALLGELNGDERLSSIRLDVNQGYGGGILAGLAAAKGDVIGWTHADLQTDPMDALEGRRLFLQSRNPTRLFVKGRRFGRRLSDAVFTAGMSAFETLLLGEAMNDINAQPTLLHRTAFEKWHDSPTDFSLDLFAYYMAKRDGLIIGRIPVRFHKREFGVSHWNVSWAGKRKFIRRTVSFSLKLRKALNKK